MAKREQGKKKPASAIVGRVRILTRRQKKQAAKQAAQKKSKLPGSLYLTSQVFSTLRKYWKPLGSIMLVYLILNIIFASGISNLSSSVSDIRSNLENGHRFWNALGGFGALVSSAGANSSQTGSILQTVLIVLVSLVVIWSLRQLLAGNSIGVKEAYYHAMMPLVPFLLVLAVIFIQLLPVTLGMAIIAAILTTIFLPSGFLTVVLVVIFAALAAWSFYMISSSIFALYVVTLPDMQPRQALRSAKNLVGFRRWPLMRKVFFLPIFILIVMAAIIVPLILYASFLVAPVFYILSAVTILFVHTYFYTLYRNLL